MTKKEVLLNEKLMHCIRYKNFTISQQCIMSFDSKSGTWMTLSSYCTEWWGVHNEFLCPVYSLLKIVPIKFTILLQAATYLYDFYHCIVTSSILEKNKENFCSDNCSKRCVIFVIFFHNFASKSMYFLS